MSADSRKDQPLPDETGVEELLQRLTSTIEEAEDLLREVERGGGAPDGAAEGGEGAAQAGESAASLARGLERRLKAAESDRRELTSRLVDSERRAERLMTLYVATYHLHAHQDPRLVEDAIAEIAIDLLGARRFALLVRDDDVCRVTLTAPRGSSPAEVHPMFEGGVYRGGDPRIDAALDDGVLRLATDDADGGEGGGVDASPVLAAVPLNVEERTSGVLVILELFEQKRSLTHGDRDLLDLLAAHAASAMLAAELFSIKERRLRTYESLVELARWKLPEGEGEEPGG